MQNHYSLWKNISIILVFLISIIYSLPNLYGDDPSVQVSHIVNKLTQAQASDIETTIKNTGTPLKTYQFKDGRVLARLTNTDDQMKIADLLRDKMGNNYTVALNLAPTTPSWLQAIGAQAMYLGLDLRGGVHFLLEVDIDAAVKQAEERYNDDLRLALREAKIHYQNVSKDNGFIKVILKDTNDKAELLALLGKDFRGLTVTEPEAAEQVWLKISDADAREIKKSAVAQNMTTLRNRVNELGVAEPVI